MTNPITEEIREVRHRLAEKFNNDLSLIVKDLQEKQRTSGREVIDRSKTRKLAVGGSMPGSDCR